MNIPQSHPTATGPKTRRSKVLGKPLQHFYQSLLALPQGPSQPVILKELAQRLGNQGIDYHPRTLKRQLQGNIRYIPEILEQSLLEWSANSYPKAYPTLHQQYKKDQESLVQSEDPQLYVSPTFFMQMADAYLIRHKHLSRRKLAVQLVQDLAKENFTLGLETLQAALAGKTLKVRQLVEQKLLGYFFAEGFQDRKQVEATVADLAASASEQIEKIEVGDLRPQIESFLLKSGGLSKRRLAVELRRRLKEKGYRYHLSSLQSVLEGKTRRTRGVVLQTLAQLLASSASNGESSPRQLPESSHWNHYVSAAQIPEIVEYIQKRFPAITRRQLALRLGEELQKENIRLSLNTLQYILAGKTRRIRRVILDTLRQLQASENLKPTDRPRRESHSQWMRTLETRVMESFERLEIGPASEREVRRLAFLEARAELIRERWLKRRHPRRSDMGKPRRNHSTEWQQDAESPWEEGSDPFSNPFDRLVS